MMFTTAGLTAWNTSANEPVVTVGAPATEGADCAAGVKFSEAMANTSTAPATAPASQPERAWFVGHRYVIANLLSSVLNRMTPSYAAGPYGRLTTSLPFFNPVERADHSLIRRSGPLH